MDRSRSGKVFRSVLTSCTGFIAECRARNVWLGTISKLKESDPGPTLWRREVCECAGPAVEMQKTAMKLTR